MTNNRSDAEKNNARPKYSIKTYLVILLIAAFGVVILSYFAQQRNNLTVMNADREIDYEASFCEVNRENDKYLHIFMPGDML